MNVLFRTNVMLLMLWAIHSSAHAQTNLLKAKRILFLGDSITHNGGYVAWIETQLRLHGVDPLPTIINLGLSSETCSGLSEPDHPFPRPDVHERLDRALARVKPDLVVACYGMNDGIYYPFSEGRFGAYQRGVHRLISKVHAAGAKVILVTPPPFDPVPLQGKGKLKPAGEEKYAYFAMYEDYDQVLTRYATWIMQQQDRVAAVIDVHTPVSQYLAEKRQQNAKFTLAGDGIHPNAEGHRFLGTTILAALGFKETIEPTDEMLQLATQRVRLLHDAWLSEVGHKRPRVKAGLPLAEAQKKADELEAQLEALVREATERSRKSIGVSASWPQASPLPLGGRAARPGRGRSGNTLSHTPPPPGRLRVRPR